jgi:glycosyltransferase involved in cell wall biosynthesis
VGLKVLITNLDMWHRSGTQLYVRDLALELRRQGHSPAVYSLANGRIGDELQQSGIPASDHLRHVPFVPDVIHGHHHFPTLAALQHFPHVPAIFICHDHSRSHDQAPLHPRIRRYFAVSRICQERLIRDGVPAGRVQLLLNFVDTIRFLPRPPLPEQPRRALVFSNYAGAETLLPAVSGAWSWLGD